jgi:hypothetical protein
VVLSYTTPPIEGRPFHFSVTEVNGQARLEAFLNGVSFWSRDCTDLPCREVFPLPDKVAGSTLLVTAKDEDEEKELVFFINDDGMGVPMDAPERTLETLE